MSLLQVLCHNEAAEVRGEKNTATNDRLRQPCLVGSGLYQFATIVDYGKRAYLLREWAVSLRCLPEFLLSNLRYAWELLHTSARDDSSKILLNL